MTNGYYSAPVNLRQTAATAAGATVWSMRNSSSSTVLVFIERISLLLAFDSITPTTRATPRYDLARFSTATPTGGTSISVTQMYSGDGSTQVTDVRFLDTGLTTTGLVFNPPFATIGCPATDATTTKYERMGISLILGVGEGFCIRLNTASIIGQSLTGEIVWSER